MKKVIISFAILLVGFACNNVQTKDVSTTESGKDSISTVEDKKDTIATDKPSQESLANYFDREGEWIQIKNALSADQAGIYVYFQAPDDIARNLRVRIQYGDASIYKFTVDGESYTYKANRSKGSDNRFVEGASLSWYDNDVKNKDLKFLQALSNGKNCQVILNDGSSFTISEQTKTGIKRTFDYFEAMDGLLPKTNMVNIRR